MVKSDSLLLAILFHFVLRLSLFFDVQICQTQLMILPSCLILASVCLMLYDANLLPQRFATMSSKAVNIFIEAILCLFLIEVSMNVIWTRIETVAVYAITSVMGKVYGKWTVIIVNSLMSFVSASIFTNCMKTTQAWEKIKRDWARSKRVFNDMMMKRRQGCSSTQNCCNSCSSMPQTSHQQCSSSQRNEQGDGHHNRTSRSSTRRAR